jgi:Tol biopolymer transport system component
VNLALRPRSASVPPAAHTHQPAPAATPTQSRSARPSRHTRVRSGRMMAGAALVGLALVAVAAVAPAGATPPGPNGRIAFMRADDSGVWQVWVSNPDLTHQQKLTAGTRDSGWATWSPDGSRLAVDSARTDADPNDDVETNDIFTMRPDGSDVVQVTDSVGVNGSPSWSPDGRWLAFSSDRADYPAGAGIYLIRPDGTGLHRVTTLPASSDWQDSPRFSPDGSKLVFTEFIDDGKWVRTHRQPWGHSAGSRSALFVVNVDGRGEHRVTGWGTDTGDADWSPDGRLLVFETNTGHNGHRSNVMTVKADGGQLVNLTKDAGLTGMGKGVGVRAEGSIDPVWSPDGTKIMFSHDEYNLDGDRQYVCGAQVINADGTGQAYVAANNPGCEHQIDWGTAPLAP